MHRQAADRLQRAWESTFRESTFIGGRPLEGFEGEWAAYCGTSAAVGVASGTDALWLSLRALGVGRGDEVIVPANTFVATVEAVVHAGAVPRFVDVDPLTLLIESAAVEAALTPRTVAVVVVHLYGQIPDMDGLTAVADKAGLVLIEDAAQAHGATWKGKRAGSFGHVGCFSFYPSKNLGALGDGGALVTDDSALAATVRSLRDHGRVASSRHQHSLIGSTSRLDTVQAGFLSAKLPYLDEWNGLRRKAAAKYAYLLAESQARPVSVRPEAESVHHLNVVAVPARERIIAHLTAQEVSTGVHYPIPVHLQPPYQRYAQEPLPVAERAAREILSLPMFPHITEAQIEHVCSALLDSIEAERAA